MILYLSSTFTEYTLLDFLDFDACIVTKPNNALQCDGQTDGQNCIRMLTRLEVDEAKAEAKIALIFFQPNFTF